MFHHTGKFSANISSNIFFWTNLFFSGELQWHICYILKYYPIGTWWSVHFLKTFSLQFFILDDLSSSVFKFCHPVVSLLLHTLCFSVLKSLLGSFVYNFYSSPQNYYLSFISNVFNSTSWSVIIIVVLKPSDFNIWIISGLASVDCVLRAGHSFLLLCMLSNSGWYSRHFEYMLYYETPGPIKILCRILTF